MIGYVCAYLRHYYPYEFLTAFLNCSESESDIANGTTLAKQLNIKIEEPKFRFARSEYSFNKNTETVYKGTASIKYMNTSCADQLYLLKDKKYNRFIELLYDIKETTINARQLDILIKLDFFSEFGNAKELLRINEKFIFFKQGDAKSLSKAKIENDEIMRNIMERHSQSTEKTYKGLDCFGILEEIEDLIMCSDIPDFTYKEKIATQLEYLGYINICTNSKELSERQKLIVLDVRPIFGKYKNTKTPWCYIIKTQSIGSGVHGSFTVEAKLFKQQPIQKLDVIRAKKVQKDRGYWHIKEYEYIF